MSINRDHAQKFANPIVSLVGFGFVIFVAYTVLLDQMDPINELLRAAKSGKDARERASTLSELRINGNHRLDKVIHASITILKEDHARLVRREAALLLGSIGERHPRADEVSRILIEALADNDVHIRSAAAKGLLLLSPSAKTAAPALIQAIESPKFASVESASEGASSAKLDRPAESSRDLYWERPRLDAVIALVAIGMDDPRTFQTLKDLVHDPDPEVRHAVLDAIGKYGSGHPRAWEFLFALRHDPDSKTRSEALDAALNLALLRGDKIVKSSPFAATREQVLSWILDVLDGDELNLGMITLRRFIELEPASEVVSPILIDAIERTRKVAMLADESTHESQEGAPWARTRSSILSALIRALGKVGEHNTVVLDTLLELADDPSLEVQSAVAEALITHGRDDLRTVTVLSRLLSCEGWYIRQNAVKALVPLENHAYLAFPAIRQIFGTSARSRSREAQQALRQMIKPGQLPKGLPPLEELRKGDVAERLVAVMASEPNTIQGFALICEALKDEDRRVRSEAVLALEHCDLSQTPDALRALAEAMNDFSPEVSHWASIISARLEAREQGRPAPPISRQLDLPSRWQHP